MTPLVVYQIVSLTVFLVGAAAAAVVVILSIVALVRRRERRILPVYLITALLYGFAMVRNFLHASSPIACSRMPLSALIGSAILLLLQIYFIWDTLHELLKVDPEKVSERTDL